LKPRYLIILLLIIVLLTAVSLTQCQKEKEVAPEPTPVTEPTPAPEPTPVAKKATIPTETKVFFAFDSADLSDKAKAILDLHVLWLAEDTAAKITLEGNCDERGSHEYNLALSQRRLDSVIEYFALNGITSNQIETNSFGEERPACTSAPEEACWTLNRNVAIVTR
jgi:peptidoglycan-associated lipoprotein